MEKGKAATIVGRVKKPAYFSIRLARTLARAYRRDSAVWQELHTPTSGRAILLSNSQLNSVEPLYGSVVFRDRNTLPSLSLAAV
jgi:hypothetical protein